MRGIALAAALLVAACSGDVRDTKLTPELLNNQTKVSGIANRLAPAERRVFERYVLSRQTARMGPGPIQILTREGKDPATVGEALPLTRQVMVLEAERDAKMKSASDAQEALPPDHTPDEYNVHVKAYNGAIADFDRKLAAMEGKASP